MSWSFQVPSGEIGNRGQEFVTRAIRARDALLAANPSLDKLEVREQTQAAIAAAQDLIRVTFPADADKGTDYHVGAYLSGHANPEHKPTFGWANDCVTVTLNQVTPAKG